MTNNKATYCKILWLTLFLAACSGSSDSDNPTPDTNTDNANGGDSANSTAVGVFTGFSGDLEFLLDQPDSGVGAGADGTGGIAIGSNIGVIRNAEVTVYRLTDGVEIGRASTGDTGLVTLRLNPAYSGGVIVEMNGTAESTYLDPLLNTEQIFAPEDKLRAFIPVITGNIGVGMYTEAIVATLVAESRAIEPDTKRRRNTRAAQHINQTASPLSVLSGMDLTAALEDFRKRLSAPIEFAVGKNVGAYLRGISTQKIGALSSLYYLNRNGLPATVQAQIDPNAQSYNLMAQVLQHFNSSLQNPATSFRYAFVNDLADNRMIDASFAGASWEYAATLNTDFGVRIKIAYDLLSGWSPNIAAELNSFPLDSYQFVVNGEFVTNRWQALSFTDSRLEASEVLDNGESGEVFDLGNYIETGSGFPDREFWAAPNDLPDSMIFFSPNDNNYLGDSPTMTNPWGLEFDVPLTWATKSVAYNNTRWVRTVEEDFPIYGYGLPQGYLESMADAGTTRIAPEAPIRFRYQTEFGPDYGSATDFTVDQKSGDLITINRRGEVRSTNGSSLYDIAPAIVQSDNVIATNNRIIYADSVGGVVLSGGDIYFYNNMEFDPFFSACTDNKGVLGQPSRLQLTGAEGNNNIVQAKRVGDMLYWVQVANEVITKFEFGMCGLQSNLNDPASPPSPLQPHIALETTQPLWLYRFSPEISFLGVAPGPEPVKGHTLLALIIGNLFFSIDQFLLDIRSVNATDFEYSHSQLVGSRTDGAGGVRIEIVQYLFINKATGETFVVTTRTAIGANKSDPEALADAEERVVKVEFHDTAQPFATTYLVNNSYIIGTDLFNAQAVPGIEIFGKIIEFSEVVGLRAPFPFDEDVHIIGSDDQLAVNSGTRLTLP